MSLVEQLAAFVVKAGWEDLSAQAREAMKIRILDSLGCAIGALEAEPVRAIRVLLEELGGRLLCSLVGGGRTAPDRAAFYNGALTRYLDFNDSYLAKGETCHPSDNLGAVLAATEYARGSGSALLVASAVAYQVQCRLCDEAPVRAKGFDHTTQGAYAVAAGVAKALNLDAEQTANAIAIAGTAFNALRVTRTGALSHWKGFAYPNTAFGVTHAAFLAKHGITGPREVLEGKKGFMDTIAGRFTIHWLDEDLERVQNTVLKKYNAEVHSQSALEGTLELKAEHRFEGHDVKQIVIEIFDVAYHIIGGGEEGDKTLVRTKEEADHSLPYLLAVAVLDGSVMPQQFTTERILREDVQRLLRRITVRPSEELSRRFPREHSCRIAVHLLGGRTVTKEKADYEGFHTRPMRWETVVEKFNLLTSSYANEDLRRAIIDTVANLESRSAGDLTSLLRKVRVRKKINTRKQARQS
ncbi:MAG: MmgE/PrpD family protein [Acidobacteria bacterium]|nr:MmgE/PrpD family protein [Acidobacteriota bacterium]